MRRMANDPTTLIAPTPAFPAGVRLRQNLRAASTAGFRVSASTALCTGEVREVGSFVAPLTDLVALPAVGREVDPRLAVDGRRLGAAPVDLARVLDPGVVALTELDQRVEMVAARRRS